MIANYHTHTPRCRHAQGEETEYIQNALKRGLQIFGFSDHTPQFFPGDYYSFMRMYPEELPDYCQTVRQLQEDYCGKLEIPLGLEAEYYPAIWEELLPRLQDQGIEYLILGQHWLDNEENAYGSGRATEDETLLLKYCRQVIEGMETGVFTYLAHPDLFNFIGSHTAYRQHIRTLCQAAKDTNTPLEINLLGLYHGKHYPHARFWEIAAEENCPVVLGMDAHAPSQVLDTTPEEKAMALVGRFGLNLLETVPLKKI